LAQQVAPRSWLSAYGITSKLHLFVLRFFFLRALRADATRANKNKIPLALRGQIATTKTGTAAALEKSYFRVWQLYVLSFGSTLRLVRRK